MQPISPFRSTTLERKEDHKSLRGLPPIHKLRNIMATGGKVLRE